MNEIMTVSLVIIFLTLNLIPFLIALTTLFPVRTARTLEVASRTPWRAFMIGMVNFVFFLVVALGLFSLSEGVEGLLKVILLIPALVVTAVVSTGLSFGLGSLAQLIGGRITPTQSTWKRTLWGALLLGLGSSAPFLGWLILLPFATWVGLGAFIIGIFQKPSA